VPLLTALVLGGLQVVPAQAQISLKPSELAALPEESWQPPSLETLPSNWWDQFVADDGSLLRDRFKQFFEAMQEQASGLDAENLVTAQNSLSNLENLFDLLVVADQTDAGPTFGPVPTQDKYVLDDVLALQSKWRALQKDRETLSLQVNQADRQLELLKEHKDSDVRTYQAAAPESPERIVTGIDRVSTRVEYELNSRRVKNLEQRLRAIDDYGERLKQQQKFAREHLDSGGVALEDLQARAEEEHARAVEKTREVAAIRKQLLDVLSADSVNQSLETLRKQQLTRASADATLAQLQEALDRGKAAWQEYRQEPSAWTADHEAMANLGTALSKEAQNELEVWSETTQATLVTAPPADDLNARKNLEIARSVARDTLVLIEQIRDVSDDLLLVQDILATDTIAAQSGLSKAWARLKLVTRANWTWASGIVDYDLFSIGDNPVTPGGIFKMLMILVIGWAISWFIRKMLDRVSSRQQFGQSPVLYTTGRMLHYLIILIAVFAALSSIGMDFRNFALIAGALSVGIGFGLQSIVNNFVSGLILLFEGSLRVGDYIHLDSTVTSGATEGLNGVVKEINTRATVVSSNDGVDVVVPNSELVTSKLTNYTLRENMGRLRMRFMVAYGSDKEKVREAALLACEKMENSLLKMPGREPQVRLVTFAENGLEFEVLVWVNRQGIRRQNRTRASFLWCVETELREAGIKIPFPQRDIYIKEQPAPSS